MTREVMALPEGLLADVTPESVLAVLPGPLLCGQRPLVVGPHVLHQVGGHVEGDAALGTPVLCREAERRDGWERVGNERVGDGSGGFCEHRGWRQGSGPGPGIKEERPLLVHRGLEQSRALELRCSEGELGKTGWESHHHWLTLGKRPGRLDEGTSPFLHSKAGGALR